MLNSDPPALRPLLQAFVALLVISGFVLSMDRFKVEGLNPIAIFGIGMFLVGFSSIDDFRKMELQGVRLYGAAVLTGLFFVGLMLAIVYVVNIFFS